MMSLPIEINFISVRQPLGEYFIGKINWRDLLKIAKADIRKIEDETDNENSFDSFLGIQRELSPNRIREIGEYVKTIDATFPTSVILSIETTIDTIDGKDIRTLETDFVDENQDRIVEVVNAEIDYENSVIRLRDDEYIARILDGQHRLEGLKHGFKGLSDEEIPEHFEFNLTMFFDIDNDDQAQIFSIINKAQTKVNKSLVYDLYEYSRARSPQKTAHDIVRLLNRDEEGPFYKKIKVLGKARDNEIETIAQATFVELLLKYISNKPNEDRDILRRKTLFGQNKKLDPVIDPKERQRRFFRNLFIKEEDELIYLTLHNYFSVVQEKWPEAWNLKSQGNVLNKSTGIIALFRFLKQVYLYLDKYDTSVSKAEFRKIFDTIDIADNSFDNKTYVPGSTGQGELYRKLIEKSGITEVK